VSRVAGRETPSARRELAKSTVPDQRQQTQQNVAQQEEEPQQWDFDNDFIPYEEDDISDIGDVM